MKRTHLESGRKQMPMLTLKVPLETQLQNEFKEIPRVRNKSPKLFMQYPSEFTVLFRSLKLCLCRGTFYFDVRSANEDQVYDAFGISTHI